MARYSKYSNKTNDQLILAAIKYGYNHFEAISKHTGLMGHKLDKTLQSMRKRELISYTQKNGWTEMKPAEAVSHG